MANEYVYTIAGIGSIQHRVNESPAGRVAAAIAAADPTDGDLDLFDPSVRARLDEEIEQSWCVEIVLDEHADEYLDAWPEVVAYRTHDDHEYVIATDADSATYRADSIDEAARMYAAGRPDLPGVWTADDLASLIVAREGSIVISEDGAHVLRCGVAAEAY